jgi:hypothetical protein
MPKSLKNSRLIPVTREGMSPPKPRPKCARNPRYLTIIREEGADGTVTVTGTAIALACLVTALGEALSHPDGHGATVFATETGRGYVCHVRVEREVAHS